jgi:hypothetical protein
MIFSQIIIQQSPKISAQKSNCLKVKLDFSIYRSRRVAALFVISLVLLITIRVEDEG